MRIRLTTRCAMMLVAVVAISLALCRAHPALGAFSTSMFGLAAIRTFERLEGPTTESHSFAIAWIAIRSTFIAFIMIFVPLLGAFLLLGLLPPYSSLSTSGVYGLILLVSLLVLPIVVGLKRRLW